MHKLCIFIHIYAYRAHLCITYAYSSITYSRQRRIIGSTQINLSIRCPSLASSTHLWLSLLISAHLRLSLSMGAQKVDRRLQRNGRLGSKVLTLRGVFEGTIAFVSFFTACGGTPTVAALGHLGPSPWQSLALLHASRVIVMYTIPLPCGT